MACTIGGRSPWTAAQLGQDLPGLEGGDREFAASADLRVGTVHGLCRCDSFGQKRRPLKAVRTLPRAPW